MPNDAKLGLVVGVGLVIAIGVMYFRKDAAASGADGAVSSVATAPRSQYRSAPARSMTREKAATDERQHVVAEGETLFSIAERYYGDRDKFTLIQRANAAVLQVPGELAPGTVLVIPDAPSAEQQ